MRDFVVHDITTNREADALDIGAFLSSPEDNSNDTNAAPFSSQSFSADSLPVRSFGFDQFSINSLATHTSDFSSNNQAQTTMADSSATSSTGVNASNIGSYVHIVSGGVLGANRSAIFIDREGQFTDQDRANLTNNPYAGGQGTDIFIEFQGWEANNNLALLTGHADNSVEQFQTLIDWGFIDISKAVDLVPNPPVEDLEAEIIIRGTSGGDSLLGSARDDIFISEGVLSGTESIRGNGGSDVLLLNQSDTHVAGNAGVHNGHYRVRDFVIDDTNTNAAADVFDLGAFLLGANIDASTIGNYIHIVSGFYTSERSAIFIDREGQFTDQDRANLTNDPYSGGHGADLFFEFQGQAGNNNIAQLTGYADNSQAQYQTLLDWGFFDVSKANSEAPDRPIENINSPIFIQGTDENDNLLGSSRDDIFLSQGMSSGAESIRGNGGSDTLLLTSDDTVVIDNASANQGHYRIRDFVIDDVAANSDADVLDISDLLNGFSIASNAIGDHLHIISGYHTPDRTAIFIDRDGTFAAQERAELTANPNAGGQGADIFLEFQGQAGSNHLADITGYADNTTEQLQALINMGFLDIA